jgi:hypothetical protein
LAVFVLISAKPDPPKAVEPEPVEVQLVQMWRPPEPPPPPPEPPTQAPAPKAPPTPKPPAKAPPRHIQARLARTPAPPEVVPVPASEAPPAADADAEVSESEVAGAATAGSGGAGQGCNMAGRLQTALRKDRMVQAAVAEAHRGKALRVWNGHWVRHGGQEGAGLAAVREAIMWEVGFAPEACRKERVHGLVMLSLNDRPGGARLVVGSGEWRWSDMLFARSQ